MEFNLWILKRMKKQLYIDKVPVNCFITVWFWYFFVVTTNEKVMVKSGRKLETGAKARAWNQEEACILLTELIQDLRSRAAAMELSHYYSWPLYATGRMVSC